MWVWVCMSLSLIAVPPDSSVQYGGVGGVGDRGEGCNIVSVITHG